MLTMRGYGLSSWGQGSIVTLTCIHKVPCCSGTPVGDAPPHCTAQALRGGGYWGEMPGPPSIQLRSVTRLLLMPLPDCSAGNHQTPEPIITHTHTHTYTHLYTQSYTPIVHRGRGPRGEGYLSHLVFD